MQNVIDAFCLAKKYAKFHPARPTTVVEMLARGVRWLRPTEHYWALYDISFSVQPGHVLGILGANGAGKSTLLRLLGGVLQPDHGELYVRGRIGALLDLGAGFHPDLTGRENIFLSGVIAGLTRREVAARFDDIVDFAELVDYIEDPLRTYSSGMQMRLAFAVASHIDPEILLIDEVLAVGDLAFQQKCLARIQQFKAKGCTIVLVTHDPALVERLCDEAIWLHAGYTAAQGNATHVASQYTAAMQQLITQQTTGSTPPAAIPVSNLANSYEACLWSQEIMITNVNVLDQTGGAVEQVVSGAALSVHIGYFTQTTIAAPIFALTLVREDGVVCYEANTQAAGLSSTTITGAGEIVLEIERLDLASGSYYFTVGIYEKEWTYPYAYQHRICSLEVHSAMASQGVLQPPHLWRLCQPGTQTIRAENGRHLQAVADEKNGQETGYVMAVTRE